jgi:hypothetical protein
MMRTKGEGFGDDGRLFEFVNDIDEDELKMRSHGESSSCER